MAEEKEIQLEEESKIKEFFKDKKKVFILVLVLFIVLLLVINFSNNSKPKVVKKRNKDTELKTNTDYLTKIALSDVDNKKKEKKEEKIKALGPATIIIEDEKRKNVKKKKKVSKGDSGRKRNREIQYTENVELPAVFRVRRAYTYDEKLVNSATLKSRVIVSKGSTNINNVQNMNKEEKVVKNNIKEENLDNLTKKYYSDIILAGTILKIKLLTGIIAISNKSVYFTGMIESSVGPRVVDLEGCYVIGQARLDDFSKRVLANLISVACSNKYSNISAVAVGSDLTEGIDARYYSRLPQRLVLRFIESFLPAYSEAKRDAELTQSTNTSLESNVVVTDVRIENPEKYSLWNALSSWTNALNEEFSRIRLRKQPAAVVDPAEEVLFLVNKNSELVYFED